MKRLRVYIDTSVVGGCFDEEFAEPSAALFELNRAGEIVLLVSDLLAQELRQAPEQVAARLDALNSDCTESVSTTARAVRLRDAYLDARVVSASSANDALHVALATTARSDVIVSWNFKHIVHLERIRGFNAVNIREGYAPLEIRSPKEVV